MKIVMDIPEEVYRAYKMDFSLSMFNADQKSIAKSYLINGLINGTSLPKGHGRLIDADKLWDSYHDLDCDFYEAIDLAETLIKADIGSDE